jgi:hypothetical protein
MTTKPVSTGSSVWPTWLLDLPTDVLASLDQINACSIKLREAIQEVYIYDNIFQRPLTSVIDQLVAAEALDPKTAQIRKPFKMPREIEIMQFYSNGSSYRLLGMLCVTRKMALVHLLDGAISALKSGNLLVAFICMRSVIEHVALLSAVISDLRSLSVSSIFHEANQTLGEIGSKLGKAARATRVDWQAITLSKDSERFKSPNIRYKPRENREDLTSKQVMNLIDRLDKRLKGVRSVYEILCEFAHPNVGLLFSLTQKAEPVLDAQGVGWIRKELSLNPPISFLGDTGLFAFVFAKMCECLTHFEQSLSQADEEKQKVLQITQTVVRHLIARRRDLLSPYALCPCGGGLKVKFCCGATKR